MGRCCDRYRVASSSRRARGDRTDIARWERSASSGHCLGCDSSRRDRHADGCRTPDRLRQDRRRFAVADRESRSRAADARPGFRGMSFAIADAAIDQHGFSACSKDEALNGEPRHDPLGAIEKIGGSSVPRCVSSNSGYGSRQELRQWKNEIVVIDDDVDGRVTDSKTHESSGAGVPRQLRTSALPAKVGMLCPKGKTS